MIGRKNGISHSVRKFAEDESCARFAIWNLKPTVKKLNLKTAVAVVLALCFLTLPLCFLAPPQGPWVNSEPVYQGRTLTSWLNQFVDPATFRLELAVVSDKLSPDQEAAAGALRAMGPKIVPHLQRMLTGAANRRVQAALAIEALGTETSAQTLEALGIALHRSKDVLVNQAAARALAGCGDPGRKVLLAAAYSTNSLSRGIVLWEIARRPITNEEVFPALMATLTNSLPGPKDYERGPAIRALCRIRLHPEVLIPEFARLLAQTNLESGTWDVLIQSISDDPELVKPLVPALLPHVSNPRLKARIDAKELLGKFAPIELGQEEARLRTLAKTTP